MIRRTTLVLFVLLLVLSPSAPADEPVLSQDPCEAAARYLQVADFFFSWAFDNRDDPVLGRFPFRETLDAADRIVVYCPFVAQMHFEDLDPRLLPCCCCPPDYSEDHQAPTCARLSLVVREEKPDYLKVSFGISTGEMQGTAYYYTCKWTEGDLQVELVKSVVMLAESRIDCIEGLAFGEAVFS